jgi:hypothetical protein
VLDDVSDELFAPDESGADDPFPSEWLGFARPGDTDAELDDRESVL